MEASASEAALATLVVPKPIISGNGIKTAISIDLVWCGKSKALQLP